MNVGKLIVELSDACRQGTLPRSLKHLDAFEHTGKSDGCRGRVSVGHVDVLFFISGVELSTCTTSVAFVECVKLHYTSALRTAARKFFEYDAEKKR